MEDMDDPWLWELRSKEERQAQSRAVEAAEFFAQMHGSDDDDRVEGDKVVGFLSHALSESDFDLPAPEVAIDLHDADVLANVLEPGTSEAMSAGLQLEGLVRDGVIHLHPEHLSKLTLLHELAHYIAPRASHGPVWCRIYVDLVSRTCGVERGEVLFSQLSEQGARVADTLP